MSRGSHYPVGAVVIGRNEGERLRRSIASVAALLEHIIYVDSGSTDGSIDIARELGAEIVALETASPFTAARARNAGAQRLLEIAPDTAFIQFVDGDCELDRDWIPRALDRLAAEDSCAVVCGRVRERFAHKTIYNRLCDLEWNVPPGEAKACGGNALIRVEAFRDAGGFREDLIAGEEPELCLRLRERGWTIRRIDADMALHDAAMTRFSQFWRRARRAGYTYAEGYVLHGRRTPERYRAREMRSITFWAVLLPAAIVALLWPTGGWSLLGLGLYGVLWWRIARAYRPRARKLSHAWLYATFCVIAKFAEAFGALQYWMNRLRGRKGRIIEYKQGGAGVPPAGEPASHRAHPSTPRDRRPALLYLSGTLPVRSETFVYREIFALRERGWTVHTASVHPSERGLGRGELDQLASETIQIYGRGHIHLLVRALGEIIRHPLRSIATLLVALRLAMFSSEIPVRKRPKIIWQALAALSIARACRRRGIGHIHAHMAHVPTTMAMFLARHLRIPFSFTGHAADILRDRVLLAEKLRRAAFCACISRWHRSFYQRAVASLRTASPIGGRGPARGRGDSPDRLPLVRCGVDVDEFAPPSPGSGHRSKDTLLILAVGRLVPKKGFDTLIQAVGGLPEAFNHVRCMIVGDGPMRKSLESLRLRHDLHDSIELCGAMTNDEVRRMIGEADLFVLPCREDASGDRDGIPVVLMEAMACGVPVIAGDIPAVDELVQHDRTGVIVDGSSVAAVHTAIRRMIEDVARRKRLAEAGRRHVAAEFSTEVNIARLERALLDAHGIPDDATHPGVTENTDNSLSENDDSVPSAQESVAQSATQPRGPAS